jgi:hypothetical protein
MKHILISCLTVLCLSGFKGSYVPADLTTSYLGIWEASLPTANTKHIWTIEKTGKNQIKILIRERTRSDSEGYRPEKDNDYTIENVKISGDRDPTFHFEKTVNNKHYGIDVSLSVKKGKLVAACKTIHKNTGELYGGPNLEFFKQ